MPRAGAVERAGSAKVPVSVKIRDEKGFLWVVYRGEEDLAGEMEIEAVILKAVEKNGCNRILHDCRDVVGPRLGTMDSFAAATAYDRRFLSIRSALLDHAEHYHENRFWETAVLNQGFTTKVFDDEAAAIAWLLGEGADC
jgi:hypothetical protein